MNNSKKAIEEYFPIVEINRLAVPERNAFKPIYTMHKWFARRSSSVFRAILLGAMKPAGTDIMEDFYKDHTNDPDTNGKVILDPFMGGGTTVVEALRLGCKVIGIDLNPVAWFIVKTEVEPVDLVELKAAFERLSNRIVDWSGRPLKETLLDLYKTECPSCGNEEADIIYTFWVKSAPCTTAVCNHQTPLFKDYIIAQKAPTIKYYIECECPNCHETFDWDIEPASLVGDKTLMVNASQFSGGKGRENKRWVYGSEKTLVECPWCNEQISPIVHHKRKAKTKVDLNILYCPNCEEVWQYRGELKINEEVACPTCHIKYNPHEGNLPDKGKFICRGTCNGNVDNIISAIRKLPVEQLLPMRPYAVEGYCEKCSSKKKNDINVDKFFNLEDDTENQENNSSIIAKNNGKFFKRFSSVDLAKYQKAKEIWEKEKDNLAYPKSEIPIGEKTKSGLLSHHYKYWHQMFNERQLLALSTLLNEIDKEEDQILKEMLLSAFSNSLNDNNMFCRYAQPRNHLVGVFARHDYQPKSDPLEGNVFGSNYGHGGFHGYWGAIISGKEYYNNLNNNDFALHSISSTSVPINSLSDCIITDPPYAGNVNYSELADFFYVWLRLMLKEKYSQFLPEYTPKADEIIENKTRGKSAEDFKEGLKSVFKECNRVSKDSAPLIFTFHHSEDTAWEALLDAVCEAGYYIEAVYPIHGEAENSLHLMNNEAISYDLIHVCKKRERYSTFARRSWASIRQEIRQRAREEINLIESSRYGNDKLPPADINILLIGKCLELYSKHYRAIINYEDKPVPIKKALEEIKMMVDQLITKDNPLPTELEDIDIPSYIYFTTLCTYKEIKMDDVSKSVRGIIDPSVLREKGLIIKRRESRTKTYYVKQPIERMNELKMKFRNGLFNDSDLFYQQAGVQLPSDFVLVDIIHILLGVAEMGENLLPWLEKFNGFKPQIRAAMEHLIKVNKNFITPAKKVLGLLDERTLFTI